MGSESAGGGPTGRAAARQIPDRIEDRVIVALDVPTIAEARRLIDQLDGIVSFFKIGMWLLYAAGVDALIDDLLRRDKKIFLDAKMYDIGETVRRGVAQAARRNLSFVTVHGDSDIMKGAVEGRGDSALKLLAITVLTSMDDAGLRQLGYGISLERLIEMRVRQAAEHGIDGVIASAKDKPYLMRERAGAPGLLVATPGIRLPGGALDDHKRSGTPAQAIRDGADYLVVGRPIIKDEDPARQAELIIADMRRGLPPG